MGVFNEASLPATDSPPGEGLFAKQMGALLDKVSLVVYRLYGHYSFNARDGGEPVQLVLSQGYTVGEWLDGSRMIIGPRVAVSVEQAIYHGFAQVVG
jgi:hypothetical protein